MQITGFSKEEFEANFLILQLLKSWKNKINKCFNDLGIEVTFNPFKNRMVIWQKYF